MTHSNLAKLTIVVPTYNRQDYISRLALYYQETPIQLLILDGSDHKIEDNKENNFPSNFEYIYLKKDFLTRLQHASQLIQTPYACLLGDDELLLPNTLSSCIDFLDQNEDFVSCSGVAVNFTYDSSKKIVLTKSLNSNDINHQLSQNDIGSRLRERFRNYGSTTVYSVTRKTIWQKALQAFTVNTSCTYSPEISFEAVISASGKTKTLSELYWLRSNENSPVSNKNWNRKFRFHTWYLDKKFDNEVSTWLLSISNIISETTHHAPQETLSLLKEALSLYVQSLKLTPQSKFSKLKSMIRKFSLPLRKIFRFFKPAKNINPYAHYETMQDTLKNLADKKIMVPEADVAKALKTITTFHSRFY